MPGKANRNPGDGNGTIRLAKRNPTDEHGMPGKK
jgi:hypothetical protein